MKTGCLTLLTVLLCVGHAQAVVTVPRFFSENMVLQREVPIPIWGEAAAGQKVTVSFAGQQATSTADTDGKWRLELKPLKASAEPRSLSIRADGDRRAIEIRNVVVGDVWVGSGQSNMAGRVISYTKNDETLAALLRQAPFPNIRLMQGGPQPTWKTATTQAVGRFSAIHFAFGERLQRALDVPIGLIFGAVGGTPSGYWIPPQTFADSKRCRAVVNEFSRSYDRDAAVRSYQAKLAGWEKRAAAAKAEGKKVPGRKPAPPKEPGESSRGGKIGGLYERYIEPVVGYRIRGVLWDQGEARSGVVGIDQYTMMSELIRGWREAWGQGDFPFLFVQKPSGGGCAFTIDNPITRNGDPFVAQLPDITKIGSGEQRYLYVRLMNDNANAWMVPAADLGSGIHPPNKWGYGNRAAEIALSQVYKTGVQAYGPTYRSHNVAGNKVTVQFDHVGAGLTAVHGSEVRGFALAADDAWQWANARIEGDTVVVWSDKVPKPSRIRYAFAARRQWANLFNKDGLPALTFEAGK